MKNTSRTDLNQNEGRSGESSVIHEQGPQESVPLCSAQKPSCVRAILTVSSTVIKNASAQYVRGTLPSAMQQSVTCLRWQKMHRSASQFMFDVFVDRGDRASGVRLHQKDVSNSFIQRARTARKSCHAIRRFFARVCRATHLSVPSSSSHTHHQHNVTSTSTSTSTTNNQHTNTPTNTHQHLPPPTTHATTPPTTPTTPTTHPRHHTTHHTHHTPLTTLHTHHNTQHTPHNIHHTPPQPHASRTTTRTTHTTHHHLRSHFGSTRHRCPGVALLGPFDLSGHSRQNVPLVSAFVPRVPAILPHLH